MIHGHLCQLFQESVYFSRSHPIHDDHEFVAAVAAYEFRRGHGLAQQLGKVPDHIVPCLVAHGIVDLFQVVQVKHNAGGG